MPDGGLQLQFDVPPEIAGGTYANVLTVWHSPHEFHLRLRCVDAG